MTETPQAPRRKDEPPATPVGKAGVWLDERTGGAKGLKSLLGKVFPDHWSFMLGEIALYSFIVLLLSGTYLSLFFKPSQAEVISRLVRPAGRAGHDGCVLLDAAHLVRRPRRAAHAADPPLGGPALRGGDHGPPVPGVLHRGLPQAA